MQSFKFITCFLTTATILTFALPTSLNDEPDPLVAHLITAATSLDRLKLLPKDSDFVFDFFSPPNGSNINPGGEDGHIILANRATFPALVGSGIAMSCGMIGPCGLNTPHTHPRSAELNFAVNGTFRIGMLEENTARVVMNTLHPGQVALFPRGAIHFEQNLGCEPVLFIAAFGDEDPGVSSLVNLFDLPSDIVAATLDIAEPEVNKIAGGIPANIVFGVTECLKRCGLPHSTGSSYTSSRKVAETDNLFALAKQKIMSVFA